MVKVCGYDKWQLGECELQIRVKFGNGGAPKAGAEEQVRHHNDMSGCARAGSNFERAAAPTAEPQNSRAHLRARFAGESDSDSEKARGLSER